MTAMAATQPEPSNTAQQPAPAAPQETAAAQAPAGTLHAASEQAGERQPVSSSAAAPAAAAAPTAAAAAPTSGGTAQLVQDCWEDCWDYNSQRWYWYNRATGVSQWHPPPGWTAVANTAAAAPPAAQQPAAEGGPNPPTATNPATASSTTHYEPQPQQAVDQQPVAQSGPVQQASPQASPGSGGQAGAAQPQHPAPASASALAQQQTPQQQHQALQNLEPGYYYYDAYRQLRGPFSLTHLQQWRGMLAMDLQILELTGSREWMEQELADVLGDEELLARWRLDYPDQAAWPGSAPPAAHYEAELRRGPSNALAQAVLAGLPVHDDTVALARMAAAAGKSIQEVIAWSHGIDYTATAYRLAARGRISAYNGQESLYSEAASWTNPGLLEQQLARAAESRKRGLTGEELQRVKMRKKELKEKKVKAWLLT